MAKGFAQSQRRSTCRWQFSEHWPKGSVAALFVCWVLLYI